MSHSAVDIIIPSYNRKKFLKRAVGSVQNQSWPNWNLLIVDDGSTDGSTNIYANSFKNDSSENFIGYSANQITDGSVQSSKGCSYGNKIKIIKWKMNRGVSYARNQGLQQTTADWIAFLDSDDEWLSQKLEKQMEYAEKNPQYPLIHCNEIWLKNGKVLNQKKKHKKQGGRVFIPSVHLCCISPSAVLIKRSLFEELGLFREDFPVCEDYEFWLRITSRYDVGFLGEPLLIKHGGHEDQLSKKYFGMDYWRIKALYPYLENKNLSSEEQRELKRTIVNKSEILLKGYKKHKNFKNKKEVEEIYKQALWNQGL